MDIQRIRILRADGRLTQVYAGAPAGMISAEVTFSIAATETENASGVPLVESQSVVIRIKGIFANGDERQFYAGSPAGVTAAEILYENGARELVRPNLPPVLLAQTLEFNVAAA